MLRNRGIHNSVAMIYAMPRPSRRFGSTQPRPPAAQLPWQTHRWACRAQRRGRAKRQPQPQPTTSGAARARHRRDRTPCLNAVSQRRVSTRPLCPQPSRSSRAEGSCAERVNLAWNKPISGFSARPTLQELGCLLPACPACSLTPDISTLLLPGMENRTVHKQTGWEDRQREDSGGEREDSSDLW